MISINVKVLGLTRPGFEPTCSTLKLVTFRFSDLLEQEANALLTWQPRQVRYYYVVGYPVMRLSSAEYYNCAYI